MKPKRKLLAAVGVITAFALVAGPLALARKGDPAAPAPRVFEAVENGSRDRDLRPAGASVGDEFLLTQELTRDGAPQGSADTTCSYVRIVREAGNATPLAVSLQCTGALKVGADMLTFQGLNSFSPGGAALSKFVITGGTGTYRDAQGELRVTETGKGTSTIAVDLGDI